MGCCQYFVPVADGDTVFSIEAPPVSFGHGAIDEVGSVARSLNGRRVALFTDRVVVELELARRAVASLRAAGLDVAVYDEVKVEPTDQSLLAAARFAREGRFDTYVSVGGGSVIDTCKAASLYATYPAELLTYVNKPVGSGAAVPGPLPPHIACPTTAGTGSECTGIAVFDLLSLNAKTGIASRALRPVRALIDPSCTATLPASVVAASGFDVLSHALESYTARPYTSRPRPDGPFARPMSQGANPWSDIGSLEALRLCGKYLVRAVQDASDHEAREQMMFAATLAGIAFGNAGVHVPHGMAYSVAGLVVDFRMPGYPPEEPLVPHGISVIVNAPSAFRALAPACPERHLEAARALGVQARDAGPADAGEVLASKLIEMMRAALIPNGIAGVGYSESNLDALTDGAIVQTRLLDNAPRPVDRIALREVFRGALAYWS
jgi:alcohol dehydrogenase class IV